MQSSFCILPLACILPLVCNPHFTLSLHFNPCSSVCSLQSADCVTLTVAGIIVHDVSSFFGQRFVVCSFQSAVCRLWHTGNKHYTLFEFQKKVLLTNYYNALCYSNFMTCFAGRIFLTIIGINTIETSLR